MAELKPSQQRAMGELIYHIQNGEKRIVLKGSAGTGKTFMTNEFIKVAKTTLYSYGGVWLTAPTHKALSVLRSKIDHEGKNYLHFATIHSGLQLKMVIDRITGKATFSREKINPKFPPFKGAVIVVVDESSMLSTPLLFGKDGIHEYPNLVFLFIGDPKQLPPVGEKESPVFTQGWPTVELTEIIRQGEGSPIIELSNDLSLLKTRENWVNDSGQGYFFEDSERFLIDKLAEVNGTDEMKYLAFTNKQCNHINHHVRHTIYNNPGKVEKGESLIFGSPYVINDELSYKNNQEVKVEDLEIVPMNLLLPTVESKLVYNSKGEPRMENQEKFQKLPVHMYMVNGHIKIIHENYDKYFADLVAWVTGECSKRLIPWPLKYWFEQQIADTTYNHAITVHKSQGSTYGLSIMDVGNINTHRAIDEKVKMLYTAVTRASHKVALFNTENITLKI